MTDINTNTKPIKTAKVPTKKSSDDIIEDLKNECKKKDKDLKHAHDEIKKLGDIISSKNNKIKSLNAHFAPYTKAFDINIQLLNQFQCKKFLEDSGIFNTKNVEISILGKNGIKLKNVIKPHTEIPIFLNEININKNNLKIIIITDKNQQNLENAIENGYLIFNTSKPVSNKEVCNIQVDPLTEWLQVNELASKVSFDIDK